METAAAFEARFAPWSYPTKVAVSRLTWMISHGWGAMANYNREEIGTPRAACSDLELHNRIMQGSTAPTNDWLASIKGANRAYVPSVQRP
jgi:hypothetical protein